MRTQAAHIQIAAASIDVTIDKLIAVGPRAIIAVDSLRHRGQDHDQGVRSVGPAHIAAVPGFYSRRSR